LRILAIDYGRKRIGLAISDPLGITAQPLAPIVEDSPEKVLRHLEKIVKEIEVEEVVVGLPLQLDGTEGLAAKEVKRFAETLSKTISVPVHLIDERLTTALANTLLSHAGQRLKKRKERLDTVAAQTILQTYLQTKQSSSEKEAHE
jgi:putative Holliday junction resolvase